MSIRTIISRVFREIAVAGLVVLAFTEAAAAADLVPHRATYDMRLSPGRRAVGVSDVRGIMVMEAVDAC
ncbi:MAG TPA: DUF1849 family protein, partial [Vineibacter sp.]|nr:DUF1849 family protein [Vineibacter sp.]